MRILITGGTGFLGRSLARAFLGDGHQVTVLARHQPRTRVPGEWRFRAWDGRTPAGWGEIINETDVVINLAGRSLSSWPWSRRMKREFRDSRLQAGHAVMQAIGEAGHRPQVLVQSSGINYYGLHGDMAAESTLPGDDFLARLAVDWEESTRPVETMGVRRVVTRSAVVIARRGGLLPLMSLSARLFAGGPMAGGRQALPWIHVQDEVGAVRFLVERQDAQGNFNLVAPQPTSNAEVMCALARALHRPYWFPMPALLLRLVVGEMSVLVAEGRYSTPARLLELGYDFRFARIEDAFSQIYGT
jgi:uncharacterized protein (TIGR01777 family)